MHNYYQYNEAESSYSKFIKLLTKFLNSKYAFEKAMINYFNTNKIKRDLFEFKKLPKFLFKKSDISIETFENRNLYIFNKTKETNTIILYFHGGAFLRNFYIFHWNFIKNLINYSPYPIYASDYPLIPEYNYKHIIEFSLKLYFSLSKKYRIILMGDSAGGNLCLSLLQKISEKEYPKKIILLSPWLDLSMTNPEIPSLEKKDLILNQKGLILAGELYSNKNLKLPEVSPIYYQYTDLPETHLFIGTDDILYPDCELFYQKYKKYKIYFYKFPHMLHDWMILDLFSNRFFRFKESEKFHEFLKKILLE